MSSDASPLTLVGMIYRNLARQPVRTTLTVLGVSLGVVAIVSFTSLIRGVEQELASAIKAGGTDMMVFQAGVAADLFSRVPETATREILAAEPAVTEIAAGLWHISPVDAQPFAIIFGVNSEEFLMQAAKIVDGRRVETSDEVVIGSVLANQLQKGVGDSVRFIGHEYQIVGVLESETIFFNGAMYVTLTRLQEILGVEDFVTAFMVNLSDDADIKAVADRLEADHPDLATVTEVKDYGKIDQGLEVGKGMVYVIGLLAIVLGSIIVANTMWMTVLERTKEIGLLRAVGWSGPRVFSMIIVESIAVGLLAWLGGSLIGAGLAKLTTMLPLTAQFNDPRFDPLTFGVALGIAVVLSVLGAAAPAWRASRISPAEALRYE